MAAFFYGTVTCNGSGANGANIHFDGPPNSDATANGAGQYFTQMAAGLYEITASHSPCADETKSRRQYDDGFHNVNFDL